MVRRKILFVTRSLTRGGGEARSTINIINNLDKKKYDIYVLELERGLKSIDICREVTFLSPIISYREKKSMKLHNYLKNTNLITIDFDNNYDCVIACNRGLTSLFASYIPSSKKIVWIRGSIGNYDYNRTNDSNLQNLLKKQYEKQNEIFYKYDKVVLVSDYVYDDFVNIFNEHKNKAIKIYNSVDPDEVRRKSLQEINIDIPKTENLIINVGRLKEVKNQRLLIDAMKIVVERVKDAVLLIIGEGSLFSELQDYINKNNLTNHVKLLGFFDNPYPIIKKGKLFCLSSISEGFCLALSEACVLGLPFVSTNVGGAKEILDSAKCGLIANSEKEDFANKMIEILTNKKLYVKYKRNCYLASKHFSVKDLGIQVDKLIESMFKKEGDNE
ncbi:MAG: glycosyltransferase [Mollicutes bacterium]|jgi:glycosyltransferase involved in cell wall biosynthesis|nr:glycosyltransferase [Mollicutes bacterium]